MNGGIHSLEPAHSWTVLTALKRTLAMFAAIVIAYLIAALAGSLIPVNAGWVEPKAGIPIYVETNGVHAGLLLPVTTPDYDWRDIIRPEHFRVAYADATYYRFGWGNEEFYRKVPSVADATPGIVLRALFLPGRSAMHVDQELAPVRSRYVRRVMVTPDQYRTIVRLVRAQFRYDRNGQVIAIPGLSATESFYAAHGRYSLFDTCNVWTNRLLQRAGIRTGLWTPFQGGVMRWRVNKPH